MSVRGAWGGHHGAVTPGTVLGASPQRALPPHRGWGRGDRGVRAPHAGAWGCSLCAQVPPSKPRRVGGGQGGLHSFCLQACLSGRARADLCIVSKRSPALSHANAALKAARCQTDEIVALFSLLRDGRRGKGPQRAQPALWGGGHRLSPHPPPQTLHLHPSLAGAGSEAHQERVGFCWFHPSGSAARPHARVPGCRVAPRRGRSHLSPQRYPAGQPRGLFPLFKAPRGERGGSWENKERQSMERQKDLPWLSEASESR